MTGLSLALNGDGRPPIKGFKGNSFLANYKVSKIGLYIGFNHFFPSNFGWDCAIQINIVMKQEIRITDYKTPLKHHIIADRLFECVWNKPEVYLPMLQKFPFVISTDFSLYSDMLLPEVMWNTFRNKLLCAWWQRHGVNVIPNVSWGKEWSHDFVLEGYPKNSIISINSTGIGTDRTAKALWMKGYQRVLEELHPIHILRYGAMQEGEDVSISTFYKNDNFNSVCHGR